MNNEQIKNFFKSLQLHTMNSFKNVSEETKNARLEICKSCEFFNESLYQCKQCGCFLNIKASWATEKCPLDKWSAEIQDNSTNNLTSIPPSGDCGCKNK